MASMAPLCIRTCSQHDLFEEILRCETERTEDDGSNIPFGGIRSVRSAYAVTVKTKPDD